MATTRLSQSPETTGMLLLQQLSQIWLPDGSAPTREDCSNPASEQAPKSKIPPLISFLEGVPDVLTREGFPGKMFPCGHSVSLRVIIVICNFFGDARWTPAPPFFTCGEPGCTDTLVLPIIPDPRAMDGLEARLDLIEFSWRKDKPTDSDMKTVSLLRDILSRIGHLSREPEPEPEPESDPEPSRHEPSESSLVQTLTDVETEVFGLADLVAVNGGRTVATDVRGDEDYCSYRPQMTWKKPAQFKYPMLSPGQNCECVTAHKYEREPRSWALTPAEADFEDDGHEPRDKNVTKGRKKTVRFVAPVVTQVHYFEPWWCAEYRDSDRYWSRGPRRRSRDHSTSVDDDWEILRLEDPEAFAEMVAKEREQSMDAGSESDTDVEDEGILGKMQRVAEKMVDEIAGLSSDEDEEMVDYVKDDGLGEAGDDFF